MGGKGSGRPKGSDKPLSEVCAELYSDLREIEISMNKKTQ